MNWTQEYQDCLTYIDNYWEKIIFKSNTMRIPHRLYLISNIIKSSRKDPHFINIPHSYFVPNDNKFKYIFYWDSFFMFRGLMGTKRQWIMKDQVENLLYLFKRYQIIPNFNAPASMGRSQPPFLSSMILDTYLTPLNKHNPYKSLNGFSANIYKRQQKKWLKEAITIAQKEYEIVWIDKERAYNHSVDGYALSRYGDRDIGYAHSSELESGWDMTSRFYNRCDQFLPIDLNTYLYKYETDFITAARILGDKAAEEYWTTKAQQRKLDINKYMWNEKEGFFYDYGYTYQQPSAFLALASFTPLWAGLATAQQAVKIVKKLPKFETPYGLTITTKDSLAQPIDLSKIQRRYHPAIEEIVKPKQWDYPSIWSPIEYQTVVGLLRYGYIEDAKRIMKNAVQTHAKLFREFGTFFEKLNGETGGPSSGFHYAMQQGFGWTNAAFYRYIQFLDAIESGQNIYTDPKPDEPPYDLAILH